MKGTSLLLALAPAVLSGCAALPLGDDRGAIEAAAQFRQALQSGDEATVQALLAPDVLIYESGGRETSRDEYMSGHMKGDMAFLGASGVVTLESQAGGGGNSAWVAARARITGKHKGKDVDIISTETLVLSKASGAWQIQHIHWSSRPAGKGH